MENQINFEEITRRTRRLEFEDGLNDLQNGFVFLLFSLLSAFFFSRAGLTFYMRGMIYQPEIMTIGLITLIPLLVLLTFGGRRLISRVRRKVLWRGQGEIVPLKWQVDRRITILAAGIWLIVSFVGLTWLSQGRIRLDADMRIMIAAGGLATGIVYVGMGRSLGIQRYQWVGIIGGLLSTLLMFVPLPYVGSWLAFGAIWTSVLGVSGTIALRQTLLDLRGASHG